MRTIAAVAFLLMGPVSAFGLSVTVSPTNLDDRPDMIGTQVDILQSPFSVPGQSNVLQSSVIREDGTGMLDFYYVIPPVGAGAWWSDRAYCDIVAGFHPPIPASLINEFVYLPMEPGATPIFVEDLTNVLNFSPNVQSVYVLRTGATAVGRGTFDYVFTDGSSGSVEALVPLATAPVPEPISAALLPLAVAGLAWRVRRRALFR